MNPDTDCETVLVVVYRSAAFDTVDLHLIQLTTVFLLTEIENYVGVTGTALDWFKAYLNGRTFSAEVGKLFFCVPFLAFIIFQLYVISRSGICKSNISFQFDADECQMHLSRNPSDLCTFIFLTRAENHEK